MKVLRIALAVTFGSLIRSTFAAPVFPGEKPPNVIYILADDLGYGDLSCYGQHHFKTPNLDEMARQGMQFMQHYSGSSVCAPSRCSLLTGKHTGHSAIRGNLVIGKDDDLPLPKGTFTLGSLFQQAGYVTGAFGKWGLGSYHSGSEPADAGFDRFYGQLSQTQAHHYYPYFMWNDRRREILWGNFGLEENEYAPDLVQQEVLRFVEENHDRPFFCYYAMILPHAEMFAPPEYMQKYRGMFPPERPYDGCDEGPAFRKYAYGSQPEPNAAFAAMINVMDDYVGALRNQLQTLGIEKHTLIIFSSDNGPHREGGRNPEYFESAGGFRGLKRDLYEGGIRVPMIACWPGKIPAGSRTGLVSAFWDILPTMSELTGQSVPIKTDGISLLPTLLGKGEQKQHDVLYWEFHALGGRVAIRKGPWKGVLYNVVENTASSLELYNIENDPQEKNNIAGKHPEIARELNQMLEHVREPSPVEGFNFTLDSHKTPIPEIMLNQ